VIFILFYVCIYISINNLILRNFVLFVGRFLEMVLSQTGKNENVFRVKL
jgi:hypothetical protein